MKHIFHVVALTTVLAIGGQTVWAQDFDKGAAAADAGDFDTALREWRPLAEQGDVRAQYALGWMYENGKGVPQDDAEAVKWYRPGAEQGDAHAQDKLGSMYLSGDGVIQDKVYAHMWFNIAASLGNKGAARSRSGIAARMTAEDISKAQQLARECVAKNYKGC